ncbi:MAG: hypothetical protein K0U93_26385 [Gammaproteobacteria bacterium]|nr:hypothetical protein [Gammaproteobacteria bacterium]
MLRALPSVLLAVLLSVGCADTTVLHDDSSSATVHLRIDSVASAWPYTPGKQGLLTVLEQEAKLASRHSRFSLKKPADLRWTHTQLHQLRHAIDPKTENNGPGIGYGVIRAAQDIAAEMHEAVDTPGASDNVRQHALRIAAASEHISTLATEARELAAQGLAADSPTVTAQVSERIAAVLDQIVYGRDQNDDGKIDQDAPEGGVTHLRQLVATMMAGEGLTLK